MAVVGVSRPAPNGCLSPIIRDHFSADNAAAVRRHGRMFDFSVASLNNRRTSRLSQSADVLARLPKFNSIIATLVPGFPTCESYAAEVIDQTNQSDCVYPAEWHD